MNIRFYKTATEPTSAEEGSIWFNTTSNKIEIKTDSNWITFGGNQTILTQSEYDALENKDENTIYFIKETLETT